MLIHCDGLVVAVVVVDSLHRGDSDSDDMCFVVGVDGDWRVEIGIGPAGDDMTDYYYYCCYYPCHYYRHAGSYHLVDDVVDSSEQQLLPVDE